MKRSTASLTALLSLIGIITLAAAVSPSPQVLQPGKRALFSSKSAAARNISNTSGDSGYPIVGTDANGAAYVAWLEIEGAYQIGFSTNRTGSWSAPVAAATYRYFGSDIDGHKSFAVAPNGTAHVVYRDADPQITNYDIWHAQFTGGWGGHSDIAETSGASSGPACAVSQSDGALLAVWMDGTRMEWEIFARARTASGSWTAVAPLDLPTGYFPDLAIDSSGRIHMVWTRRAGGSSSVLYVRNDGLLAGAAWMGPIEVKSDAGEEWSFPKVDCDNAGNAIVAWMDGTTGNDEIFVRKIFANGSMSDEANVSVSPAASTECDVAVNRASGSFSVAWTEGGEILLRSYTNSFSAISNVSNTATSSGSPSVALDAKGQIHIAWHEELPGNAEIFYDSSGGPGGTTTTTVRSTTTTSILIKPEPPLDPVATTYLDPGRASKTVLVSWQRNPANAGIPLSEIRIWRKRADQADIDFHPVAQVAGDALSYADGPLSLDQRYTYALTAVPSSPGGEESRGSEAASEASSFPPLDVKLQTVTNSSLFRDEKINVVGWANSPLNATVRIVQFNIYRRPASQDEPAFKQIASVAGTVVEFRDRKLSNDKYEYVVTAVDSGGSESVFSDIVRE